jgi:hypothetical protein
VVITVPFHGIITGSNPVEDANNNFMKKILKPAEPEEVMYYSDFTGKPIGTDEYGPQVTLKLEYNYGSKYDTQDIEYHLSDDDVDKLLTWLKSQLHS